MWQRSSLAIIISAALAGCAGQPVGAQGYYGGGDYYGGGSYGQYTDVQYSPAYGTSVSFGLFYNELAPYGRWYRHPRWGDVWHPTSAGPGFRPYYRGHWANTIEFGWTWVSDYPWGGIPFHYGRWVYDPFDGWLWVPGYVWAPAWVVWRSGGGTIGWFPMPPDDRFLAGFDVYRSDWDWNLGFGYRSWYGPGFDIAPLLSAWVFIDIARFGDRDYYNYVRPQNQYVTIINNTTNVTNYVTVNNRIVNRSIDVAQVERASGRRIERVAARDVIRAPITTVDVGRQTEQRERRIHGGNPNASARERVRPLPASEVEAVTPPAEQRGRPQATPPSPRAVPPTVERARPRAEPPAPRAVGPALEQRGGAGRPAEPSTPRAAGPDVEQRGGGRQVEPVAPRSVGPAIERRGVTRQAEPPTPRTGGPAIEQRGVIRRQAEPTVPRAVAPAVERRREDIRQAAPPPTPQAVAPAAEQRGGSAAREPQSVEPRTRNGAADRRDRRRQDETPVE